MRKIVFFLLFMVINALATTPTYENVTKLYVAMFERAPDASGLNYWVNDSGLSLEDISESFFYQTEAQEKYPPGTSASEFVNSVYDNLFNRQIDKEGAEYWTEEIQSGKIERAHFVLAVINGAQGNDALILEQKTISALNQVKNELDGYRTVITEANAESILGSSYFAILGIQKYVIIPISKTAVFLNKSIRNRNEKEAISCPNGGYYTYEGNDVAEKVYMHQCIIENVEMDGIVYRTSYMNNDLKWVMENCSIKTKYEDSYIKQAEIIFREYSYTYDNYNTVSGFILEAVEHLHAGNPHEDGTYTYSNISFVLYGLLNSKYSLSVNGLLKTPCSNGWLELNTIKPLAWYTNENCSIDGEVNIIGGSNSLLKAVVDSDSSINLFLNGEHFNTYADCYQMPNNCQ